LNTEVEMIVAATKSDHYEVYGPAEAAILQILKDYGIERMEVIPPLSDVVEVEPKVPEAPEPVVETPPVEPPPEPVESTTTEPEPETPQP
jgi:hypothetical protein